MKIVDVKSAAAAFPDRPEECREWCRWGDGELPELSPEDIEDAVERLAKVALELRDSWVNGGGDDLDDFLRMMAGGDDD